MSNINELSFSAIVLASSAWRAGDENVDFKPYEMAVPREDGLPPLDLAAVGHVVTEAMTKFADNPEDSDGWLAPRLHATLRLSRREASRTGLWRYLGMVLLPDYIRWRWGSSTEGADPATAVRFHGDTSKHAFGRLWWGAELFRNGPDYASVEKAFDGQDLMNNLFRMDIAHHRPTAQAAVAVLFPQGKPKLGGDATNALSKAANAAATTLLIDAVAPDAPLDTAARTTWMKELIDAVHIVQQLPVGPGDLPVPQTSVDVMAKLFEQLLTEAPFRRRKRANVDGGEDITPA